MKRVWWKESVVYQIYPRSFKDSNGDGIGDLNGITEKLPYIKELGADVIWLSPIYQSPNVDNGYDISDYQSIMDEFGTMEDFDRMLARAHELGLKIMLDLVVNHTSDEHRWFVESYSGRDNPYRDFYIWREPKEGKEPNNWGANFGGSAWTFAEETGMYYLHLFAEKQPDLNWENEAVRDAVYEMMTWWCDKGIDGFRMDVISLISKVQEMPDGPVGANGLGAPYPYVVSGPRVHEFLQEMNERVLSRYDLITIGEAFGVTLDEAKKYANSEGTELNMVFHFEHMGLDSGEDFSKWCDKKISLPELKQVMTRWQKGLDGKGWNSLYWCNHDQPRIVSRFGNDAPEYREVSAKMLATCLHMMQGTPYIFQGEELGMTNYPFSSMEEYRDVESIQAFEDNAASGTVDPETMLRYIAYKSRDNARTPMQWDDTAQGGFTAGTPWIGVNPNYRLINAAEQMGREDSVFHYYQKLIRLRKEYPIIVYGAYDLLLPDSEEIYAYLRRYEGQTLLVVCSFTEKKQIFEVPGELVNKDGNLLISNYETADDERGKGVSVLSLRPYEADVILF
ncbi:MAG: alpha-glucosidase [Clostridiales bacterium]|nr:alpha-glucosidase [Clostridiales bacterium]